MSASEIIYRRSPRLHRQPQHVAIAQSYHHVFFDDKDLMMVMLQYFDTESCLRLSEVSKSISIICNDDNVWKFYCHELWRTKVHCPYAHISIGFKSAYYRSFVYSRHSIVSQHEVTHWIFNFRFKCDAGETWISNCPWHLDREATVIRLKKNMMVTRYVRKDDTRLLQNNFETQDDFMAMQPPSDNAIDRKPLEDVFTQSTSDLIPRYKHGHSFTEDELVPDPFFPYIKTWSLEWKLRPMMQLKNLQKKLHLLSQVGGAIDTTSPSQTFSLFELHILGVSQGFDSGYVKPSCSKDALLFCLHSGFYGNTVKINVQGVPVPSYLISRSPLNNWGFVFQSCWAVYTSWRMPLKGECALLEDKQLKITVESQLQEVNLYNNSMIGVEWLENE